MFPRPCPLLVQGIEFTHPFKFPSARGFTFCCWLRIEAFPSGPVVLALSSPRGAASPTGASTPEAGGAPVTYAPLLGLFHFMSDQKKGLSAWMSESELFVQVSASAPSSPLPRSEVRGRHTLQHHNDLKQGFHLPGCPESELVVQARARAISLEFLRF